MRILLNSIFGFCVLVPSFVFGQSVNQLLIKSNTLNVTTDAAPDGGGLVISETFDGDGIGNSADVSAYWGSVEGGAGTVKGNTMASGQGQTIGGVWRANKSLPNIGCPSDCDSYNSWNRREEVRGTGGTISAGEPPHELELKKKYHIKYKWRVTSNHIFDFGSGNTIVTGSIHAPNWAAGGSIHQNFKLVGDDLKLQLAWLWSDSESNPPISQSQNRSSEVITNVVKDSWYYIVREFRYNPDPGDTGVDQAEHYTYISTGGWPVIGDLKWDFNAGNDRGLGFKHLSSPSQQTGYVKIPGIYAWRWGSAAGTKLSYDEDTNMFYEVEVDDYEYGEGWSLSP